MFGVGAETVFGSTVWLNLSITGAGIFDYTAGSLFYLVDAGLESQNAATPCAMFTAATPSLAISPAAVSAAAAPASGDTFDSAGRLTSHTDR